MMILLLTSKLIGFSAVKDSTVKRYDYLRIGLDISKIPASLLSNYYKSYELTCDVHFRRDIFWVLDGGWGNSQISNNFISFKSNNTFLRAGLDKTFFSQEFRGDMDNAFIGLRYGMGFVTRGEATYFIKDTIYGNAAGVIPKTTFAAQWLELVAGFRIEIVKNVFLGWNIRAKTFVNPKKFAELPPAYIAGYGRGDKNTAFGYNFYLLYGFGKKRTTSVTP